MEKLQKKMYTNFIKPLWQDIKEFILDILFPISCLGCDQGNKFICSNCISQTKPVTQICIVCKKPSLAGLTHPNCKTKYSAEQLICLYNYKDDFVSKLIIKGKYYYVQDIFKELANFTAVNLKNQQQIFPYENNFIFTSIPLHNRRLNWRGFNQSEVFSKTLAEQLHLTYAETLKRIKSTKIQKDLKKEQRLQNLENAFVCLPNIDPKSTYVLIDDVITTGTTLAEATKILKLSGINKVICLAIARD